MFSLYASSGTLLGIFGLYCLRRAWLIKLKTPLLVGIGWASILGAISLWGASGGGDRGVAWGMIVISLLALGYVGHSALKDMPSHAPKHMLKTRVSKPQIKQPISLYLKRIGTFMLTCLLMGFIAFLGAMGLHEALIFANLHPSNTLVAALFVFPIAWASLITFILISQKPILKTCVISAITLGSSALLIIGN